MENYKEKIRQEEALFELNEKAEDAIENGVTEGYKKIENGVLEGYKKMENGVVGGYKKIENAVVDGFNEVSDKIIEKVFSKDGESVEDTKKRLLGEENKKEEEK